MMKTGFLQISICVIFTFIITGTIRGQGNTETVDKTISIVIDSVSGDSISKSDLFKAGKLQLVRKGSLEYLGTNYILVKYTAAIAPREGQSFMAEWYGNKLSNVIKNHLYGLKKGDLIAIANVSVRGPDGKLFKIPGKTYLVASY
jgi:hypothetical protein